MKFGLAPKLFKLPGLALVVVLALVLGVTTAAGAGIPTEGVVVEGTSVPGVELGFTRSEVEASYGAPDYCQSVSAGDLAYCTYNIPEGQVSVRYEGPDGGDATASGDDVLYVAYWVRMSDWVTTAGINTDLALEDPDAVIAAYPDATVTYNQWGIYSVRDAQLGIEVVWVAIPYPVLTVHVRMSIFEPIQEPPPPPPAENQAPIADAGPDQTVAAGSRVTLDGSASYDPDGSIVSYAWKQVSGKRVKLSNADSAVAGFKAPRAKRPTVLLFELTATDDDGAIATDQVSITVQK